jgi:replicative DNA helicase
LALAKVVEVEPWPGWREPANLFTAVVMPPGSRKSIVFKHVTRPVCDFEEKTTLDKAPEIAEQQTKFKIHEQRVNKLQQEAAKAKGDDFDGCLADAMKAAQDLASIKVPAALKLLADDATPEALATLLVNQGGRMALMSPEGDVFDMMSGRYSQGVPNLGVYLKGHAGDPIRVDRSGRLSEMISAPALTIGIAVQPEVLHGLTERPGFRGRGLLGRFLYSLPPNNLGKRNTDESPPVPSNVEADYRNCVKQLLNLSPETIEEEIEPAVLKFSEGAKAVIREFMAWLEPQLAPDGELGSMTDWAGKLAGAVARLAGILYIMELAGASSVHSPLQVPKGRFIPERYITQALKFADYFLAHARAAFAEMGADPVVEGAKHILAWIDRTGVTEFTKREAFQGTKGRFHKVSAMEPGLELLVSHGHIREETNQGSKSRGRPSVRYTANPLTGGGISLISHSQYSQYPQK